METQRAQGLAQSAQRLTGGESKVLKALKPTLSHNSASFARPFANFALQKPAYIRFKNLRHQRESNPINEKSGTAEAMPDIFLVAESGN
ncbi:MAG: hypothetical protein ACO1O6_03040 [Bacteroidota bacterium]